MTQQELAALEWYYAMGVDEVVEETPQNRLTSVETTEKQSASTPLTEHVAPSKTNAAVASLPDFAPSFSPAPKTAVTSQADALVTAQQLAEKANSLAELKEAIHGFDKLSICQSATQPVFAQGAEDAPLMVIGEAPGADEDRRGIPFCGVSGQLLDKMLAAIGMSRQENTYITNSIFWRPPGNRTPSPEEISICQPFVQRHIALQKPKILLLLGGVAVRSVLGEATAISRLRGKKQMISGEIPAVVSYHPSYLLRQPSQKKLAWQDMLTLDSMLNFMKNDGK